MAAWGTADQATSLPNDQRGDPRPAPDGHGVDIGAFELCTPARPALSPLPCIPITIAQGAILTMQVSPANGGATTPPAGQTGEPLGSVISIVAMPNPGYAFAGWSSNVTDQTSASTTVTLNQDQTVTASFVLSNLGLAVEYYYSAWNYYFMTSFPDEIAGLDGGAYGGVWKRTGQTFKVWQQPNALVSPTCRFFSVTFAPKSSHFYTPFPAECAVVKVNPNWEYESIAFYLTLADANGNCPPGTIPLYRAYNNGMGGAPNHRYMISLDILNQMIAAGWVFEGNLVNKVFACVPA
jgi:hypothetical protein